MLLRFERFIHLARFTLIVAGMIACDQGRAEPAIGQRALLIGVTAYPNVGKEFQLQGGETDVSVMARVLRERFGFSDKDIAILSERDGQRDKTKLPTRENIEAAFARLTKGIREGDRVVIFLSGHGTELPTPSGPRGFFLPRDVSPWKKEGEQGHVPNAIAGTEIGNWLRPIAESGANLWVIVDACFSGRMVRGAGTIRQLPTDPEIRGGLTVPRAIPESAAKRGSIPASLPIPLTDHPGVVCLYACRPDEVTLEERVTIGDANAPVMGLLTRSLSEVLLNASSDLTYRELHRRIRKLYASTGRTAPNPILEGAALHRNVLQSKIQQRKNFVISETTEGELTVNAGRLHGLTSESILAVYPPPGGGDILRGYVQLGKVGPISSECRPFAERGASPAKKAALIEGRAEIDRLVYGESRLPVAIDHTITDVRDAGSDRLDLLQQTLQELAKEKGASFRLVDSLSDARLIVRCSGDQIHLYPIFNRNTDEDSARDRRPWTTHQVQQKYTKWLREQISQCARASALLQLHTPSAHESKVQLSTDLFKLRSERSDTGERIPGAVKKITVGDHVAYEVKNTGNVPIDVTILYLDSNLEIDALYPLKGELNRLTPGDSLPRITFRVGNSTIGPEHAVIIAVENSAKESIELTALAPARRSVAPSAKQLEHPLGRFLSASLEERGKMRSVGQEVLRSYTVDILPIRIVR